MYTGDFLAATHLEGPVLDSWIEFGWLAPEREGYSEVDMARACLIHDLQRMGVNDDSMPIILDLIDQMHGLRRAMRTVLAEVLAKRRTS